MKTTLWVLVLCAPLAIGVGCGFAGDDETADRIAACRYAGGTDCDNDSMPDDPDNPGGVGVVQSGLVVATAPSDLHGQPFVGDFYFGDPDEVASFWKKSCHFNGDQSCAEELERGSLKDPRTLACQGTSSCEIEAEGEVTIEFRCPKHLFLPRTVSGNQDEPTNINWNAPGDWGLAPNGTYIDKELVNEPHANELVTEVTTEIRNGEIRLIGDGNKLGTVKGNSFAGVDTAVEYSNGVISEDLKAIFYRQLSGGQEFYVTLMLVE